jgi:acetyl esterase/lipase
MKLAFRFLFSLVLLAGSMAALRAAEGNEPFKRQADIIYGRKFGTALTMDVFSPTSNANGRGVVYVVSGGWYSAREMTMPSFYKELTRRGYTVFAVVHGSQPKFTIPEILEDMHRAVRFIHYHAKEYQVDPERLGITGASAGGHLSLMQGVGGGQGNPKAPDVIDRGSSRVAAVACFFPPTDFLNYGKPGENALGRGILSGFKAPFDFQEFDAKKRAFVLITDEKKREEIGRKISPVNLVTREAPPTLIIHGNADTLVPIQQAQIMIDKLKSVDVPAELVVKKGGGHGWKDWDKDVTTVVDWFDAHLLKKN